MEQLLDALRRAVRPRRLPLLVLAAAVGIATVVIGSALRSETASPVVCGERDELATIWNAILRAQYLSSATTQGSATEEAAWFDWYVRALDEEYGLSCGRADSMRIACLDQAAEDLRTAIARAERRYWPRLRALDRCGNPSRERDLGGVVDREEALLSSDGRELLVLGGRVPSIRRLDGAISRPVDLEIDPRMSPLKLLSDGSIVGQEPGRIAVLRGGRDQTLRHLEPGSRAIDVSLDLRAAALASDHGVTIVPMSGGTPYVEPLAVRGGEEVRGAFSPDARRFALLALGDQPPTVYIDDLVSRHRTRLPFRLHLQRTGVVGVRWLDSTSIVLTGSAVNGIAGDVWRVRVNARGDLDGPPQVLQRAELEEAMLVHDVQAGKLLVERIGVATKQIMLDGGSSSSLPGLALRWFAIAADPARRRLLALTDTVQARWAWLSLETESMEPIAILDGVHGPVIGPSGLAWLDRRSLPPAYVARDDAGAEVARVPIDAAGNAPATLRCGRSSCVVMWTSGGANYTVRIEGRRIGPAVRHDKLQHVTTRFWELAPDGNVIAAPLRASGRFLLYDLEHSVAREVTSELCPTVQLVRFFPDGALALSGLVGPRKFVLVRRELTGEEQLLWSGDSWIEQMVPIDERRVVLTTISWQSRLSLFELE